MSAPEIKFLSLFVPDLQDARRRYALMLGVVPEAADSDCLGKHPFAAAGPVVFALGPVKIALYQCDMKGTHPGDVGIGLEVEQGPDGLAQRARGAGARVFHGPTACGDRRLAVLMVPDRHFFEVVGPKSE